ncbi:AVID protein, partial [Pomatostomus ruficeps]|nr:AVID protein [Pomatostomus ruficeps]
MVQATPFLLVILLALGAHGISTEKCIMTGCCVNDLGSNMTILNVTEKGDFNGTYYTAVSGTTKKIEESPLLESQQLTNPLNQPTFGFTVHWNFTDSISVFMGQCFMEETQKEVLRTMWLLRLHADKRGDNWNAT